MEPQQVGQNCSKSIYSVGALQERRLYQEDDGRLVGKSHETRLLAESQTENENQKKGSKQTEE